ncbi:MAG: MBL fold metallo-hydrolase [Parachlamydiaceae bacterium]|nr:MBL fold metallo-hydrolase [Parachlamydiaceae bacterium]
MIIKSFPTGPYLTNAYVFACEHTHHAAIIDPAPGSFPLIKEFLQAEALNCKYILLTHSHWDHIADVKVMKEFYHIPVYVHLLDAPNLIQPGSDGLPIRMHIDGVQPDFYLEDQMNFQIGLLNLRVIYTPGHSPGGVCFFDPDNHVLFTGDTLFKGCIGNLTFPTCEPAKMWPSLEKLILLPSKTVVYPGHGMATTMEREVDWLKRTIALENH